MENNFDLIKKRAQDFKKHIEANKDAIAEVLSSYQPYEVTIDEIRRSADALAHIGDNEEYYNQPVGKISAFLPTNLPLYSTVLFGVLPSYMAESVHIRPNKIMQDAEIFERLAPVLQLESFVPNLSIENLDRDPFNERFVADSDCVIFTGSPNNSRKILDHMKKDALLIVNGAGHNPIVVSDDADLEKAVKDAVYVKRFNSGQDCAGADAILVHKDVAEQFIKDFIAQYSSQKVGPYTDYEVTIGPIFRVEELLKFGKIFHQDKKYIESGGMIDLKASIVAPTVMVSHVTEHRNYAEMFGPVAYIHVYDNDQQLASYFEDDEGRYKANRMYVSLYGTSDYISRRDDSKLPDHQGVGIVIHGQNIHDYERGNKPYGGYAIEASGVIMKKDGEVLAEAKPTNVPRELYLYLIKREAIKAPEKSVPKSSKKSAETFSEQLAVEFKEIVQNVFGKKLSFAFIFGDVAKGDIKRKSTLDTFICLKEEATPEEKETYLSKLIDLQAQKGLEHKTQYPYEIATLQELQDMIRGLDEVHLEPGVANSAEMLKKVKWTQILHDRKIGFTGEGRQMSQLIKKTDGHLERWKREIDNTRLSGYLERNLENYNQFNPLENLLKFVQNNEVNNGARAR